MADDRRQFLHLCSVSTLGVLAGCVDSSSETQPSTGPAVADQSSPPEQATPPERSTPAEQSTSEPISEWARTYGTSDGGDTFFAATDGVDGGHLFVGGTTGATSGREFDEWFVKCDSNGTQEWEAVPTDDDGRNILTSACSVADGYVAGGFSANYRGSDARVVKIGIDGTTRWNKTYANYEGWAVLPGVPDGYLLVGSATSPNTDGWVQKLDRGGNNRWSKTIDDGGSEVFFGGDTTADGYILAGYSTKQSPEGYLVKIDTDGAVQWSNTFAGEQHAELNDVVAVDGGYVAVGVTYSGITESGTAADNALALRVDDRGNTQWSTVIDKTDGDFFNSVVARADGSLYAAGETNASPSPLVQPTSLVVELTGGGDEVNSNSFGLGGYHELNGISLTDGGASMLTGSTTPPDKQDPEGWAIKTADPLAGVPEE